MIKILRQYGLWLACALAAALPAAAVAQDRIYMVPCRTNDCWGGPSPQDSMTPRVRMIEQKIRALNPLLPADIRIEVMIVGGLDFSHQVVPGRPHLISIGVNALAELHNNWVESFYSGGQQVNEAFDSIIEWSLYHEIGHALLEHAAQKQPHLRNNDQNHERLADRFATVALMFANRNAAARAGYASQGIYAMRRAQARQGAAAAPNTRDAYERPKAKRRNLDGILGVHSPTEERAWNVLCYVWGSGLAPPPGELPAVREGRQVNYVCNERDFNNIFWELRQYMPFLPERELNRVSRYDPERGALFYVR